MGKGEGGNGEGSGWRSGGEGERGERRTREGWYLIAHSSVCGRVGRSEVCRGAARCGASSTQLLGIST
jgi:hypothetical protein